MDKQTTIRCQQFIENRDKIKPIFSWENGMVHLACAGIYTDKEMAVDEKVLQISKEMIKSKTGAFSGFKGIAKAPIAAMMAVSGNPEQALDNGLRVYECLKKEFWNSSYLPVASMIIGKLAQPSQFDDIIIRTRLIYNKMKAEHPFLTSSEDSIFCSLMALSGKSNDNLINEMERCYKILKENFSSSNATQSLSHVLALCDGSADEKCEKTLDLFNTLKSCKHKYGTSFELPTLGILAMSGVNLKQITSDIIEIDDWLSTQKGFGMFSTTTPKQRLMYAGILARQPLEDNTMTTASISGVISIIIAQQAAMCAVIAAASASAASN